MFLHPKNHHYQTLGLTPENTYSIGDATQLRARCVPSVVAVNGLWVTDRIVCKIIKAVPYNFFSIISNDTNCMSKPYPKVHSIVINPLLGHIVLPNTDFIPIPLTWASVRANVWKISSSVGNHFSGSFSAILTHNRRRKFSTKRHVIVLHCILPSTETKKKISELNFRNGMNVMRCIDRCWI